MRFAQEVRAPHEVSVLAFLLLAGIVTMTSDTRPNTLTRVLDPWAVTAWCVMLTVGSAVGLLGAYWRGRMSTSLLLEKAGLYLHAGVSAVYVWALAVSGSPAAVVAGSFVLGFGSASVWRIVQITKAERLLARARDTSAAPSAPAG